MAKSQAERDASYRARKAAQKQRYKTALEQIAWPTPEMCLSADHMPTVIARKALQGE